MFMSPSTFGNLSKACKKKYICSRISAFCAQKYLSGISFLSDVQDDAEIPIDETSTFSETQPEKLYCYSCQIKFVNFIEMRKHQWTRMHRINSGWVKLEDEDDSDDNNNILFDEHVFEEEVEVDDVSQSSSDDDPIGDELELSQLEEKTEESPKLSLLSTVNVRQMTFGQACAFPMLYFRNGNNEIVGIRRCLLFTKQSRPDSPTKLLEAVSYVVNCKSCAVLLYSGGSFAGAIFDGNKQILHKTIKRYTTRRKQGGSQIAKDNQGTIAKSAGSYLRRVNTQKLIDDVYQLLHQTWAEQMRQVGLILIWSAKNQRHIFGSESLLNQTRQRLCFNIQSDPRVRHLTGRVAKVNSTSLLELYRQVSSIEIYDSATVDLMLEDMVTPMDEASSLNTIDPIIKKKKLKKHICGAQQIVKETTVLPSENSSNDSVTNSTTKSPIEAIKVDEKFDDAIANDKLQPTKEEIDIRNRVLNYVLNDSPEDLVPYLNELKLTKSSDEISEILSTELRYKNQSLLHVAVNNNNVNVIRTLLENGCDPVHRNDDNETPYALAIRQRHKDICKIMSDYMFEYPDRYDYFAAKFPGGKDPLKELERRKLQLEKKKQYKKDRKQRHKLEEEQRRKDAEEQSKRDAFLNLDNSLKINFIRQVQRDRRKSFLLCFQCALDISDTVPFSYCDYSFCGMDCLKKHRLLTHQ